MPAPSVAVHFLHFFTSSRMASSSRRTSASNHPTDDIKESNPSNHLRSSNTSTNELALPQIAKAQHRIMAQVGYGGAPIPEERTNSTDFKLSRDLFPGAPKNPSPMKVARREIPAALLFKSSRHRQCFLRETHRLDFMTGKILKSLPSPCIS